MSTDDRDLLAEIGEVLLAHRGLSGKRRRLMTQAAEWLATLADASSSSSDVAKLRRELSAWQERGEQTRAVRKRAGKAVHDAFVGAEDEDEDED